MPRVLYVGNFEPDHSTENDVRRAFEHLGWDVDRWQERDFIRAMESQVGDAEAVVRAQGCDLVLHTMTQGNYPPQTVRGLWEELRAACIPTASIPLDLFYGLSSPKDQGPQRQDLPRLHPMFQVDHVFTADGDHQDEFARDGVNHHWLPPAVRHDEARHIEPTFEDRAKYAGIDVAFIGSRGYHPEWPHRPELVDRLRARYGGRFAHVGGGADADLHGDDGGALRGEALNRALACIPVIVGDYCFADRLERYWSDRFPETWGRGGFLVFPFTRALVEQVGPYPSWPVGDWDALFAIIDAALGDEDWRDAMRARLHERVARDHTYVNRVQTMLDVIGLGASGPGELPARRTLIATAEHLEAVAAELRAVAEKVA